MFGAIGKKLFGTVNERTLRSLYSYVDLINDLESRYQPLSDEELKAQTDVLRNRIAQGATLDDILPDAFAVVREASKRALGMRHFDVQMLGGVVLHKGKIAEMRTGEGKTLVSTLPAYLNALEGKGVHIVTVNDYLARRDSEWMGKIFRFLGLTVGCIVHDVSDQERREAYHADITYGTNNELGFDYLRDNMKFSLDHMVQRSFNYAIIDEVDSILIDEARTPLIISGPTEDNSALYTTVNKLIPKLVATDIEKDEKARSVTLTEDGTQHMEKLLVQAGLLAEGSSLYDMENISLVHHTNQALRAHHLFTLDVDYMIKDDKVMIIDEFTGRMMEGRRYSEGLHQALEAKENVTIQNENQTLASITFQNYFRLYPKLSGMTGTAMTEAEEFQDIYKLDVVEIPTNLPVQRIDEDDEIYASAAEKYKAILDVIEERHAVGQPILVGTISIEKSEYISKLLTQKKITHSVLNARYHEQEASIIAQAGRFKAVTIATNMAGRGTDIKLGGNPEMLIESITETDEIARQKIIAGIEAQVEDEKQKVLNCSFVFQVANLCEFIASERVAAEQKQALCTSFNKLLGLQLTPENLATSRDSLVSALSVKYADQPNKLDAFLQAVKTDMAAHYPLKHYKLPPPTGGLFVLATERHESRRIDNQLRGRSGRQGDPGYTKFYLSLEDDLMRIFGGERIKPMMQKLGMREGEAIFHPLISKSLEKAQQKVEARNYDIRKNLLKYDDVMSEQRKVIYEQRIELMRAEDVSDTIADMRREVNESLVTTYVPKKSYAEEWDIDTLHNEVYRIYSLDLPFADWAKEEGIADPEILTRLNEHTDAHAAAKEKDFTPPVMRMAEKRFLLLTIDQLWKEHLLALDHLRQGINLRAYGQKDPLNEYKREAFMTFDGMLTYLRYLTVERMSHMEISQRAAESEESILSEGYEPKRLMQESRVDPAMIPETDYSESPVGIPNAPRQPKVGRNEDCPCGSGKKYKHCHGKLG